MSNPTITALRSLVDTRFPVQARKPGGVVPTGIGALDQALDGGLSRGRLTELVSAVPGSGGQSVLAQLLETTRGARQRVALIDAADGFAPDTVAEDALRHVVWVRPAGLSAAFTAVDVLIRDGNYALLVLDLRGVPESALVRTPKAHWHRLHRAAESQPAAVLIQTTLAVVPAVPYRLILSHRLDLAAWCRPRSELLAGLHIEVTRSRSHFIEELAG